MHKPFYSGLTTKHFEYPSIRPAINRAVTRKQRQASLPRINGLLRLSGHYTIEPPLRISIKLFVSGFMRAYSITAERVHDNPELQIRLRCGSRSMKSGISKTAAEPTALLFVFAAALDSLVGSCQIIVLPALSQEIKVWK